jgi:thiol-disulfide isomerase/thioredoxin
MIFNKYVFLFFVFLFVVSSSQAQLKVGDKAPEIVITNWIQNVPKSKDLKGKFIIIDFWATWCAPCLESVPHMNDLVDKYKSRKDLVFLAITDENAEKVNRMLKRVHFSSIVVADTSRKTSKDYKATSIPMCVVIDDKNQIQWVGHAAKLTKETIEAIINGKAAAPQQKGKSFLPDDVLSSYNSLLSQYYKEYQDDHIKEYFKMEPLSRYRWGATVFRIGNGFRRDLVVGDSLVQRLAGFLNVSDKQIILPGSFAGSCVSYIYKSSIKYTTKNVMDTVLNQMKLGYKSGDSLMNVIQLVVEDEGVLKKYMSGQEPHVGHASNSDSYAAIDYDEFSKLTRTIEQKFKTTVVLKNIVPNTKMSMTLKIDNMKNLIESFREHGISVNMIKKKMPVYIFVEKK